jgi:hypothetical protein
VTTGVTLKTCAELQAHVTSCVNAAPATPFTVRLDCRGGENYDCSGLTLSVTGRLSIRRAGGCARVKAPELTVAAGSGSGGDALFKVSGAGARLSIRDVTISLAGTRPAIAADGADRVVLRSVDVSGGAGASGGALSFLNTRASVSFGSLTGCNATGGGGGVYFKADAAYKGASPALRLFRVQIANNKVGGEHPTTRWGEHPTTRWGEHPTTRWGGQQGGGEHPTTRWGGAANNKVGGSSQQQGGGEQPTTRWGEQPTTRWGWRRRLAGAGCGVRQQVGEQE